MNLAAALQGGSGSTIPSTRHVVKRLGLAVYKGVQGRKHWSLWASVHSVLQVLRGRRLLGQASWLQRGHGSAGGVVGADVLLVTSSAVLEPDLGKKCYLLVAKQWRVKFIIIFNVLKRAWICPGVCLNPRQHLPTVQMMPLVTQNHPRLTCLPWFVHTFIQSASCQVVLPSG